MTDVVAALLMRDGRVLAARRTAPPATAGRWEFPGGKVEPGEDDASALRRECREELGIDASPQRMLAGAAADELRLRLWLVTSWNGEPRLLADHDELRWLRADELDQLDWLPLDRDLLAAVRAHLDGSGGDCSHEHATR